VAQKRTRRISPTQHWWESLSDELRAFKAAQRRCKKSGVVFDITVEDVPPMPTHCPISGLELRRGTNGKPEAYSPSLDRVDNTKGYVPGNIQWLSYKANSWKGNMTLDQIKRLYEYSIQRN